jgi:hypothetical protein
MYLASFSPDGANARAAAEHELYWFFDGIEREMMRLPTCTGGDEWDNRRKQFFTT